MSLLLLFAPFGIPVSLTTLAPNRIPTTGFLDSELLEVCKLNAQALVLGATGVNHSADLTVSAGHTHNTPSTRLAWRQIASHLFVNNEGFTVGAAPAECYDATLVSLASTIEIAALRLWVNALELADIIPRVRVSNDNSATATCEINFDFYEADGLTLLRNYTISFDTSTARSREWIDGVSQDLSGATADTDVPTRYPLLVFVSAQLDAAIESVALHEIAFGVTP